MVQAFGELGIKLIRINQSVTRDGSATNVLASTRAYLVGKNTEKPGKPFLFVRKRLGSIEMLPNAMNANAEGGPERWVIGSSNPVVISSTRHLAVAIVGYEQYVAVTQNLYIKVHLLSVTEDKEFHYIGGTPNFQEYQLN